VRGGACRAKYAGAPTTTTLEDQGIIFTQVTLPPGATREETARTMDRVRDHYLKDEKNNVAAVFDNSGYGFVGQGQNVGIAFIRMNDWSERKGAENSVPAIVARANAAFKKIRVGQAFAFSPPAALELGNACRRFP
jgi:HAE1 family hydrophobic/amphiphilic exporter-1/multidrug efflux pump